MIEFRQKSFSEYDAMRSLYTELQKCNYFKRGMIKFVDKNSLIPILRGNNIVIERFVISHTFFGKDKYRMYLKIGARAKMPERVRLPGRSYDKRVGSLKLSFGEKIGVNNNNNQNNQNQEKKFSMSFRQKEFGGNGGGNNGLGFTFQPEINISYRVDELLGNALSYDKNERSLVLEFNSIHDAIEALQILPFGINYNIYLLKD